MMTSIILRPIKTEKSLNLADRNKEIVVEVDNRATKADIAKEFEDLFGVKVVSVRTHITPKGKKRAIVKVDEKSNIEELATKLKMM